MTAITRAWPTELPPRLSIFPVSSQRPVTLTSTPRRSKRTGPARAIGATSGRKSWTKTSALPTPAAAPTAATSRTTLATSRPSLRSMSRSPSLKNLSMALPVRRRATSSPRQTRRRAAAPRPRRPTPASTPAETPVSTPPGSVPHGHGPPH